MNVLCLAHAFQIGSWIYIFYRMHGCFPLGMLSGPPASLGFGLRILGPRVLSLPLALESLAIYLFFFKVSRKKSTHYSMLRESYHYYCGLFPPSFFLYASKVLLPSSILYVFLFTCIVSQWACITCIITKFGVGGDKGGSFKSIFVVHCFSQNFPWEVVLQV